jgi:DNA invertase Pin-like site-specific DNA recombinase
MNIDSSTSQGRLLRHVMAAFAEYESDVKSDYARTNYALLSRAERAWGGRPPSGDRDVPRDVRSCRQPTFVTTFDLQ